MKKIVMGLLCGNLLMVPAWAAPSVNGSTGLINTPTADVLREGEFSLGYYRLSNSNIGTLNVNVLPTLEIGAATLRHDSGNNRNVFNAKLAIAPESILTPGIAIGVEDAGDKDSRSVYAVASKALPFGFRIHAGVGNGRLDGGFASLEKTLNPLGIGGKGTFPTTTLIAEYDGKNMNYCARLSLALGWSVDAGRRNHEGYVGISFTK